MSDNITCPKCGMTSHHPMDVKMEWCENCSAFHYALRDEQPIHYNTIISSLMAKYRAMFTEESPFRFETHPFTEDGRVYWRAFVMAGSVVLNSSCNPQLTPGDALRELAERVDGELDAAWMGPLEEVYRFLDKEGADTREGDAGGKVFVLLGAPAISGIGGQEVIIKENVVYFVDGEARFLANRLRDFSPQGVRIGII